MRRFGGLTWSDHRDYSLTGKGVLFLPVRPWDGAHLMPLFGDVWGLKTVHGWVVRSLGG